MSRNRNSNSRNPPKSAVLVSPPTLVPPLRSGTVIRFKASALVNARTITWKCLRNLIYVLDSGTTGKTIFESFKINSIHLYAPSASAGGVNELTVELGDGDGSLSTARRYSKFVTKDTGTALHVKFPEGNADIGKWHSGSYAYANSSVAFYVDCPIETVIDLSISFQLPITITSAASLTRSNGVNTAGTVAFNYLDNTTITGAVGLGILAPIGPNDQASIGLFYG